MAGATARVSLRNESDDGLIDGVTDAFAQALREFEQANGRKPNYETLSFSGGFATHTAVIDIWEDD